MIPLLQVEKLNKFYPIFSGFFRKKIGQVEAVKDANFELYPSEVLGIIGESGSGKSTLARALLKLIEPTSGKLVFEGVDYTHFSKKEMNEMRKKMQIVFQNPSQSLNPRKTISEILGEVLVYHHMVQSEEEKQDRIEDLLQKVRLDSSFHSRYPHELSIGQQQRVSIARALSLNPSLLVLDECVSALDISIQAQVLNLLQELLRSMKMSYLFISHDLRVVEHLADRVLVMCGGNLVEQGKVEDVFHNPQHPYTKLLLSSELPEIPVD